MQQQLATLVDLSKCAGLKINVAKTKLLRVGVRRADSATLSASRLRVGDQEVEEVDHFCYLGSMMTNDGGALEDVKARINKARQAFASLREVWRSSVLSRNLKLRLYNSNVMSVLLYGSETWMVTRSIVTKLQVFNNSCLRRIFQIRWPERISNLELWSLAGLNTSLEVTIRRK